MKYLKSKGLNLMTNEVSINWNKNQSTERPIFEMFDDSEFESIQQEAMALYGEACYVQESYEEYILEAAENEKTKEPMLRKIGLTIKALIERFIRAIERFMKNQACNTAIKYFSNKKNMLYILGFMPADDEGKKKLLKSVQTFYNLLEITKRFESNKTKDLTVADVFNVKFSQQKLTSAFTGDDAFFTYKNMKHIIHVMEKEKVRYTAAINTVDQESILNIYTTIIKKFAELQSDFIAAYKHIKSYQDAHTRKL